MNRFFSWLWEFLHEKGIEAATGFDDDSVDGPSLSMTKKLGSGYDRIAEEEEQRERIIEFMRKQLGEPYIFGIEHKLDADDPYGWDCSELGQHGYDKVDLEMPDGARYQFEHCRKINTDAVKVGDPLFLWSTKRQMIGHVMYYSGDGMVIHAVGGSVGRVVEEPLAKWTENPRFRGARRHPDFMRPKEDRPPGENLAEGLL